MCIIGEKMRRRKINLYIVILFLGSVLVSSTVSVSAAVYPYSVSTGDKIAYNVVELKNGTDVDWLIVKGLNLSRGDNFFMEIFDRPANPTTAFGTDFTIRFVKGEENGDTFPGNSLIFSNNKTYWQDSTNLTFDVGGTIYSYTYEGDTATWSWTTDADNFVKVTFDINDGLLQSFERKAEDFNLYGHTHFKFVKGSISPIPSFEVPVTIASIFLVTIILRNKRRD